MRVDYENLRRVPCALHNRMAGGLLRLLQIRRLAGGGGVMSTLRDYSRRAWTGQSKTIEEINAGSLQRIADACELMCKDREKLERDYKWMRESRDEYRLRYRNAERSRAALRGQITKLKKKLAEARND
jgi:hypothetical protein